MNKEELLRELAAEGYEGVRELPATHELAGVLPQIFTTALAVGLDQFGYKRRYCYENKGEAASALLGWDGVGDPPGNWIKEKPSERLNQNWSKK